MLTNRVRLQVATKLANFPVSTIVVHSSSCPGAALIVAALGLELVYFLTGLVALGFILAWFLNPTVQECWTDPDR
jgi:hypothetical protein